MRVPEIAGLVERFFRERAAVYHLDPANIRACYVLNWGGFVNASFTVKDGRQAFHLKLARYPECITALRRWHALRNVLEGSYRAP